MKDKSLDLCDDKPNCVSTLDTRKSHFVPEFTLVSPSIKMQDIVNVALSLPHSHLAEEKQNYARIEFTSRFFRFVDDLELRRDGENLIVRSESRTGYYDFEVNKKRTESLRTALHQQKLIK